LEIAELQVLPYGTKVIDNRTGEELYFSNYTNPYVLCTDVRGLTIWLAPDRIELKDIK
jgi:hypothetical protein